MQVRSVLALINVCLLKSLIVCPNLHPSTSLPYLGNDQLAWEAIVLACRVLFGVGWSVRRREEGAVAFSSNLAVCSIYNINRLVRHHTSKVNRVMDWAHVGDGRNDLLSSRPHAYFITQVNLYWT